jgi:hypothetical protein
MLESVVQHSAAVGVIACLISESKIMAPIRNRLGWSVLFCPVCLGFWLAVPTLFVNPLFYFTVVGLSNVWMLIILHTYEAIDRTYDGSNTVDKTTQA